MSLYICPKTTEFLTARVNPSVNYGFWVFMMCRCRFINFNKCTTLGMLIERLYVCMCIGM